MSTGWGPREPPTSGLVGRERELSALEEAFIDPSWEGSGCFALVGEPGIGKTALMREACRRAVDRGFEVAAGSATEFEHDVPFAVLTDALEEVVGGGDVSALAHLDPERVAELASVFPALAGRDVDPVRRFPAERYLIHDAVRRLLESLAADRPLLLALDDVHWADEASLELVAHLIRRPPVASVRLLIALRPGQAPRLAATLTAAAREGSASELALGPLGERDGEALLGERLDRHRQRTLYEESGGNPLYLIELARAVESGGPRQGGPLPRMIAATIAVELERLDPPALALLRAASAAGDPFDLELAGRMAGSSYDERFDALDRLVAVGLVDRTEEPTSFRFRHPIVRRAVYESTPAGLRMAAHRRAADTLAHRGASLSARAHHIERCAENGDEDAIELLEAAGREDAGRSPGTAARWFAAALRLLPDRDPARRLGLIVRMASGLAAAGRTSASSAALLEALELVPEEEALTRARILGFAASAERLGGDPGAARGMLTRALAKLGGQPSAAASALRAELAIDAWLAGDWDGIAEHAGGALADARAIGDHSLEAEAGALLALGEYQRARAEPCERALEQAMSQVDSLSVHEPVSAIPALLFVGYANFGMEHWTDGVATLRRGLTVSRETGQELWLVLFLGALSIAELWQGHLSAAAGHADEAVEAATLLDNGQLLMWALAARCWVSTLQGELEAAVADGEHAREAHARSPDSGLGWVAHCCLGAALVESGDPAGGRAAILRGGGNEELSAIEPSFRSHWYEILSRAALTQGDIEEAERWLSQAELLVKAFPLPGRVAELRRGKASVLLARGDPAGAADRAAKASNGFRAQGQPVDAARAEIIAARALAQAGRPEEAVRTLTGARESLDRCGADGYRAEAERELATLGVVAGPPPLEKLSARESEVAALVAAGMTNREIAAELVVTHRTVEHHLTRIYAKLAIGSRSALAAAVERSRGPGTADQR